MQRGSFTAWRLLRGRGTEGPGRAAVPCFRPHHLCRSALTLRLRQFPLHEQVHWILRFVETCGAGRRMLWCSVASIRTVSPGVAASD
jgi:hypothetical protein